MMDHPLFEPIYGIYSVRTMDVHRSGMTHQEAVSWMDEAVEIFPGVDPWKVWGIWTATPVVSKGLTS